MYYIQPCHLTRTLGVVLKAKYEVGYIDEVKPWFKQGLIFIN